MNSNPIYGDKYPLRDWENESEYDFPGIWKKRLQEKYGNDSEEQIDLMLKNRESRLWAWEFLRRNKQYREAWKIFEESDERDKDSTGISIMRNYMISHVVDPSDEIPDHFHFLTEMRITESKEELGIISQGSVINKVILTKGQVAVTFDLTKKLNSQMEEAKEKLTKLQNSYSYQRSLYEKIRDSIHHPDEPFEEDTNPIDLTKERIHQPRNRTDRWITYLRLLDSCELGIKPKQFVTSINLYSVNNDMNDKYDMYKKFKNEAIQLSENKYMNIPLADIYY